MPKLQCTYDEAHRAAKKKVGSGERTDEWQYECFIDGKFFGKVTIPQGRRSDEIPIGTLVNIRRQLRLNSEQFIAWKDCSMSREDYQRIIRSQSIP